MENEIQLNKEAVLALVGESTSNEMAKKYIAWAAISKNELLKFKQIGLLSIHSKYASTYKTKGNYWAEDHPIDFDYYPYHSCAVYEYMKAYFLVYEEVGGHYPELRCRYLQKNLII